MGRVKDLVAGVIEDGSFDVTEAQALRWLGSRHTQLVARSGCYRKTIDLGPVTEGNADVTLPAEVIEILQVTVGDVVYGDARHGDFARGERGWLWLVGEGGIAGRDDDAAGVEKIRLFSLPGSAGLPDGVAPNLHLYVVARPPALDVTNDATLVTPSEYDDALVSGALATGMLRDEALAGLAAPFEQIFTTACQELLRTTNRKYRGDGPARVRVLGATA